MLQQVQLPLGSWLEPQPPRAQEGTPALVPAPWLGLGLGGGPAGGGVCGLCLSNQSEREAALCPVGRAAPRSTGLRRAAAPSSLQTRPGRAAGVDPDGPLHLPGRPGWGPWPWLWPDPALAAVAMRGVTQRTEDSVSLPHTL